MTTSSPSTSAAPARWRRAPALVLLAVTTLVALGWAAVELSVAGELGPLVLGTIACGVACSVVAAGWRAPLLAARAATLPVGAVSPRQVLALQHLARGTLMAGITLGAVAVFLLFARVRAADASPAEVAGLVRWSLLAPAVGVLLGRVVLGSLVDAVGGTRLATDRSMLFGAVAVAIAALVASALPS